MNIFLCLQGTNFTYILGFIVNSQFGGNPILGENTFLHPLAQWLGSAGSNLVDRKEGQLPREPWARDGHGPVPGGGGRVVQRWGGWKPGGWIEGGTSEMCSRNVTEV